MQSTPRIPEIVKTTAVNAMKKLTLTGCKFKVISPWGEQYGDLEVIPPKKRTINPNREYGAIAKHYDQYLNLDAKEGEVTVIPCATFTPQEIRSGICSRLSREWGKQTYQTMIVGNTVQIIRLDKKD